MAKNASSTRPREALPDSVYVLEYIYLILLFTLLFGLMAIVTFDPADSTLFNMAGKAGTGAVEHTNAFGPTGASVADWSYQLFGIGSIIFSFVFIAQILNTFRKPVSQSRFLLRLFGYPQLVLCYLGFLHGVSPDWSFRGASFLTGGVLGQGIFAFFASFFGQKGASIALAFGICASLPLCLGVRPLSIVTRLLQMAPFHRVRAFAKEFADKSELKLPSKLVVSKALPSAAVESGVEIEQSAVEKPQAIYPPAPQNASLVFDASTTLPRKESHERSSLSEIVIPKITDLAAPSSRSESKSVNAADFEHLVKMLSYHGAMNKEKDTDQERIRLQQEALLLEEKLGTFGVLGKVVRSQPGPVVNVHEFEPAPGVKAAKVMSLQDDLALGLKAQSVLMAPQSGKSTIGIEIPAQNRETVSTRELLESAAFHNNRSPLPMALGKHVDGSPLIADLSAMPHLLVAGSTGSGKSVGINGILLSLMMNRTPSQLRLILVDPKMLELSVYDGIGHLLLPVVTDPSKAAGALKWAIDEMERRYRLMRDAQVRNISGYNSALESGTIPTTQEDGTSVEPLPYIVVVIDELCDLMMTAPKDVEDSIQRLAQKARAAGIHLILATQRPSVDVITGVIKANLPCRISYQVASKHDSRTIIETIGAERLLGRGDMLFLPPGTSRLVRAQGAYVDDKEINTVATRLKDLYPVRFDIEMMDTVDRVARDLSQKNDEKRGSKQGDLEVDGNEMDENTLYDRAVEFAIASGSVSTSSIQRNFRIGYNRAARLIDKMAKEGLVGPSEVAGKPRQVIVPKR